MADKNKSANLRNLLHEYAIAVCDFLLEKQAIGDDPLYLLLHYSGGPITSQSELQKRKFPILELPQTQLCIDMLEKDEITGSHLHALVGCFAGTKRVSPWIVLHKFMYDIISRQGGTAFDRMVFEEVFDEMLKFFQSNTLPVRIVVPLENFILDAKSVQLTNDWHIGKIPDDIRQSWLRMLTLTYSGSDFFGNAEFALIKEMNTEKIILHDDTNHHSEQENETLEAIRHEMELVVSALRLFKAGSLLYRRTIFRVSGWHVGFTGTTHSDTYTPSVSGGGYALNSEECIEIRRITDELRSAFHDTSFHIALRRLNYAVERGRKLPDDRVLDSLIALESLFAGQAGELGYRLSLRVAMFLGVSTTEREEVYWDTYFGYRLRSRIVHGSNDRSIQKILRTWEVTLDEGADRLENLLRRSIRKYIQGITQGRTREATISAIDNCILQDATLPAVQNLTRSNQPVVDIIEKMELLGGVAKRIIEWLREKGKIA